MSQLTIDTDKIAKIIGRYKNPNDIVNVTLGVIAKDLADYFSKENDRLIFNHKRGEQLPDSTFNRKQFLKKAVEEFNVKITKEEGFFVVLIKFKDGEELATQGKNISEAYSNLEDVLNVRADKNDEK